jgi:pyruvate dehydrogenase E2 component (dihydrolipoamide acetyltransferase)
MTENAGRKSPPAQIAKIATAGATGMFVFGLAGAMGWADRPSSEPGPPTTAPVAPAPTTTALVPLATTIPTVPAPAPIPAPPPVEAAPPTPAPPPTAPVIVVSEQSQ